MFVEPSGLPIQTVEPEMVYFSRQKPDVQIPMYFIQQKLILEVADVPADSADKHVTMTMEVGLVSDEYQTNEYFDWPLQNIIGLAPSIPEADQDLLKR